MGYLEQLMRMLKRAGLVTSVRGAGGGYHLAKPATEISVGDILRALEGNLDAVTCPGNQEKGGCQGADLCVTRFVWQRLQIRRQLRIKICLEADQRQYHPGGGHHDAGTAGGGEPQTAEGKGADTCPDL